MTAYSMASQDATPRQLLGSLSTPPSRPSSSRLFTPGQAEPVQPPAKIDIRTPPYLRLERVQIQKRFQELEWQQRFRMLHGYNNPHNSPFRIDRSDTVTSRNRYGNVQPWDSARVKLKTPIGGSDYINASPISLQTKAATALTVTESEQPTDDYSSSISLSELRYIATQGPKDDQFLHFWTMIMQETVGPVGVIVMLTQCYEGPKEKCAQYFPGTVDNPVLVLDAHEGNEVIPVEIGDPFIFPEPESAGADCPITEAQDFNNDDVKSNGGVATSGINGATQPVSSDLQNTSGTVTLLSLQVDPISRSEIRHLRLEIGEQSKEVYHYLFNGWPDYGKPEGEDRRALLKLTKQSRDRAGREGNPRFVHCSAGVGRTGTFIALDFLLHELEQGHLAASSSEAKYADLTENQAAYQENNGANATASIHGGGDSTERWSKSGLVKESTPEAKEERDLVFETVNKLREQRMMMVMNEVQYAFLYEVVMEAFVEKYARVPKVGVAVADGKLDEIEVDTGTAPKGQGDSPSEAETEIEVAKEEENGESEDDADPYRVVAPESIRAEREGGKGVGAE